MVENLKNLIIIGDSPDGELMVLVGATMEESRYVYMMFHAMERARLRDYEPPLEDIEIDEDELEEADGEATDEADPQDAD